MDGFNNAANGAAVNAMVVTQFVVEDVDGFRPVSKRPVPTDSIKLADIIQAQAAKRRGNRNGNAGHAQSHNRFRQLCDFDIEAPIEAMVMETVTKEMATPPNPHP